MFHSFSLSLLPPFPTLSSSSSLPPHSPSSLPLLSSAQVNLKREFVFRNSKQKYHGIPVIASNMDTVGTFEMAKTLAEVSATHCFILSCM